MTWCAGRQVLDHGKLLQSGTTFICHPKGKAALEAAGFRTITVTRDTPDPERFIA